jgi:Carboxypeptidase regulatory-like domain
MRRCSKNLVVAVVACFLFSTGLLAQNAALLLWRGVLRDAAGVPIQGAGVRLKGKSGTFNTTTDTDGQFRIELIPAGQYQLSVDANHDKIQHATPINIAGASPAVVITLSAQKSLSVTLVTDQRPATGGEALSSQTVSVLPLNKRDFSQLLLLAAGTMTDANGATNFTQQFAVNGQRGVEAVLQWTERTSAIPRWAAQRSLTSMLTRSNYDFAFIKDTPFGKRKSGTELVSLQFRAEFFNIFNIVTMGLPANTLEGAGFGVISKTAGNSRQIQFSLKIIY